MAKTRRTRMSAENDHRRVTWPRLRITVKETRGYPTGYLRASSDTIQRGLESREVGYGTSTIILGGYWIKRSTVRHLVKTRSRFGMKEARSPVSMPLPTSNPGALITTVGGILGCRIALYANSIAALQVRTAARQGEWCGGKPARESS